MTNEELAELERQLAEIDGKKKGQLTSLCIAYERLGYAVSRDRDYWIATAREAEALRAEIERLRGALRVYAGPMEWTQEGGWGAFPVWADGYPGGVYVDDNTLDYGDAARAALGEKQ